MIFTEALVRDKMKPNGDREQLKITICIGRLESSVLDLFIKHFRDKVEDTCDLGKCLTIEIPESEILKVVKLVDMDSITSSILKCGMRYDNEELGRGFAIVFFREIQWDFEDEHIFSIELKPEFIKMLHAYAYSNIYTLKKLLYKYLEREMYQSEDFF